ncbi:MAG: acetyl-CoA carboxylase biotin carboxyl carrier protein [Armatimonadota bacterium]
MEHMDADSRKQLEALLQLFREHGLLELEVQDGSFKLSLRRELEAPHPADQLQQQAADSSTTARRRQSGATGRPAAPTRPRAGRGRTVAVRSPLIGVFYRAPAPDLPPFVEIGDVVQEGQTVCVVEAMKVFNEIKAEWKGRVVAIPPENAALVQAGDPLVVLEFASAREQEGT